ncbi:hypothetical protein AB4343_13950 [Vibrio breoganii]|uniref:Uncharacterized protein n=1 Tax=Vibrio breoganii TaxID=553239 RepID=A0ABX1U7W0_9VIBR|nr:hypothetical protein [Vibrio breoganii]MDN3716644.1 hypothetical protein [Vibrio breoganii]NMO71998.1 hypothetical protein [Vibrio breoganii]NMR70569.1 hypothetical protein [Vibrio breoganii]
MIYSQHADEINKATTHKIGRLIAIIVAVKIGLIALPSLISSLHGLGHFF